MNWNEKSKLAPTDLTEQKGLKPSSDLVHINKKPYFEYKELI